MYTNTQLRWLFFWLLFGDFAMFFAATSIPQLLPLHLDMQGFSTGVIGWIVSISSLVGVVLSPFVGVWSDRTRTRWGRRRPFLLFSTPAIAIGMILLPHVHGVVAVSAVVAFIQAGAVLQTVVYYLYSDVIPPKLMGRFMGAFRFVGVLAALLFQYFLMPHFDTDPVLVWTLVGFAYLACLLSIYFIREGEYAPPEPMRGGQIVATFIKDGVGSRYIWMLWGTLGAVGFSGAAANFYNLFIKHDLGLNMTDIGRMNAMAYLPVVIVSLPGGWLLDKFGPRILWGTCTIGTGLMQAAAYFWVTDYRTMFTFMCINAAFNAVVGVAMMPMLYAHLPRSKFGQLVSAQTMVVQSLVFVSSNLVGWIIYATSNNYRVAFLYGAVTVIFAPIFAWRLSKVKSPFSDIADEVLIKGDKAKQEPAVL